MGQLYHVSDLGLQEGFGGSRALGEETGKGRRCEIVSFLYQFIMLKSGKGSNCWTCEPWRPG